MEGLVILCVDYGGDLREILNIPNDSIVIGRHGGNTTFDIHYVHECIKEILTIRQDIYFLLYNIFYRKNGILNVVLFIKIVLI